MTDETKKAIQECRKVAMQAIKQIMRDLSLPAYGQTVIRGTAQAIEEKFPEAFNDL